MPTGKKTTTKETTAKNTTTKKTIYQPQHIPYPTLQAYNVK